MTGAIDVVIPAYGEADSAVRATIEACLAQSGPVVSVWLVDDGSPQPITCPNLSGPHSERVTILRVEHNLGISAARMHALARCRSEFVACVNAEVLPAPGWAAHCLAYLQRNSIVGAVYTGLMPARPSRLLSRWRMRFHEQKYDRPMGPATFAPGHAVLFRRQAIDAVGGYDARMRRVGEDFDICDRMWNAGWETHYAPGPGCTSIQSDTLLGLARKQLARDGYDPLAGETDGIVGRSSRTLLIRLLRNLAKGRFTFIPIDFAIWAIGLFDVCRAAIAGRNGAGVET